MRRLALASLRVPLLRAPLEWMLRGRATVFMLHRFAVPELGVPGHDPDELRGGLAFLRQSGYQLLSLRELTARLAAGEPVKRAVAFTIDDGYEDQAEVAGPVFADYDCPVTTFVCTGFLDRELWMWWDKVEHVFEHTPRRELSVQLGNEEHRYSWQSDADRIRSQLAFIEACKRVPAADRSAAIDTLAGTAEVELPEAPPPRYAPMSWEQLRRAEERGMRFGPHTLTHPILSRTGDEQARREIEGSRDRLKSEATDPDPVFCYPNGQVGDFGPREFEILDAAGFESAVVGTPGYASADGWDRDRHARFQLRRFSYPSDRLDMLQCVSGLEWLKSRVRGEG